MDGNRYSYSKDAYAARLADVARVKVDLVAAAKSAAAAAAVRAATAAVDANLAEEMAIQAEAAAAASLDAARAASDDAKSERVARLVAAAKAEVASRDATPVSSSPRTPPTNQKREIGVVSFNRDRNAWVMEDIDGVEGRVTAGPSEKDLAQCRECGQHFPKQTKEDAREDKRARVIGIASIVILAIAIALSLHTYSRHPAT
jgi:hypothetical protein